MKEDVDRRHTRMRMVLAFLALSMVFVDNAYAQRAQDLTHSRSLVSSRCRDNDLSLRHDPEDAAMGGLRSMQFFFTNTSSAPCTLEGYPSFQLVGKSGKPARGGRAARGLTRMGEDLQKPPQVVTIEPGKTETFYIDYLARGAGAMGKPCPTYRKFRITAPGTKRVFVQSEVIELCSGLEVSPILVPTEQ